MNDRSAYKRIMIFGRPGSGKSTFAVQLHRKTGVPVYHLDKYFYTDRWVERDYDEFLAIQQNMVNHDAWIIDGNSTKSLAMRWERAQLVVYFKYPRWLCYWRVFKRLFSKDPHIDDRAQNCPETIAWSLLKYIWTFEKRVAKIVETLKTEYPHVVFYEIGNDKELFKFYNQVFNEDSV